MVRAPRCVGGPGSVNPCRILPASSDHPLAKDRDGFLRALDLNDVTILGHSGPDAIAFSKGFGDRGRLK